MKHTRLTAAALAHPCLVHLSLDGLVTETTFRCDTIEDAAETLNRFRAVNWTDPQAFASIWDVRALDYAETWNGGIEFGPPDKRHPMEKVYRRAIEAGLTVRVITERASFTFDAAHDLAPVVRLSAHSVIAGGEL